MGDNRAPKQVSEFDLEALATWAILQALHDIKGSAPDPLQSLSANGVDSDKTAQGAFASKGPVNQRLLDPTAYPRPNEFISGSFQTLVADPSFYQSCLSQTASAVAITLVRAGCVRHLA